jgi:protein-arginine kinase
MSELGQVARRSLAERGVLSRSYAADDFAPLLRSRGSGCYALIDELDHLRISALRPGLDPLSALIAALAASEAASAAIGCADSAGPGLSFARRPGIGWICSRLGDCGLGATLSVFMHIPALSATGMRDRLFRALMAEGIVLRGIYSSDEESSGSVYAISLEPALFPSLLAMAEFLSSASTKVIAAERRARTELASRGGESLTDLEGRAFGILRNCRLLGADEAASLLSILRLASLRGSLGGTDYRALASLLVACGPGSVALASGLEALPQSDAADALRARKVKAALSTAEYRSEEGT